MALFQADRATKSARHQQIYARYELIHTCVDLAAALFFILGSAFFFFDSLVYAGTWLFLIGSVFFAVKPLSRFMRELHMLRLDRRMLEQERVEAG